jgi:hypothetical protein
VTDSWLDPNSLSLSAKRGTYRNRNGHDTTRHDTTVNRHSAGLTAPTLNVPFAGSSIEINPPSGAMERTEPALSLEASKTLAHG